MKNVKKLLKTHKSEILPDEKIKDNIKRELLSENRQYSFVYAHNGEKGSDAQSYNKRISFYAVMLVVILFLGMLIPVLINRVRKPGMPPVLNKFAQITDADSFYAYSAASVGTILSSFDIKPAADSALPVRKYGCSTSSDTSVFSGQFATSTLTSNSEQLASVNRYMPLVEGLMSENVIEQKSISGEYGYAFGMKVRYTDLRGNVVSYDLFYNKSDIKNESGESTTEKNYSITGVLIIKNSKYPVEGFYEEEIDGNESESEFYFKAFTNADKTSYIEARQKLENEIESDESEVEREFIYSVYHNGVLTEQTVIEYESEKDELELKMSIAKDGTTDYLCFKGETEKGKQVLLVRGNIDGQTVYFRVYIQQDGYRYVFEDGSFSDNNREDEDDDDSDDEEDD